MSSFIATSILASCRCARKKRSQKQYECAAEDPKRAFTLLYKLLLPKNTSNRLRRFGALGEPVLRALCIDLHLNGVRNRVILSNNLQKTAVSRPALIDYNDPVKGPFLCPNPGKTH